MSDLLLVAAVTAMLVVRGFHVGDRLVLLIVDWACMRWRGRHLRAEGRPQGTYVVGTPLGYVPYGRIGIALIALYVHGSARRDHRAAPSQALHRVPRP